MSELYTRTVVIPQNTSERIESPYTDEETCFFTVYSVSGNGSIYIGQDTLLSPVNLEVPTTPATFDGIFIPATSVLWLNAKIPLRRFIYVTYNSTNAGSYATVSYRFERVKMGVNMPTHALSTQEKPQPQLSQVTTLKEELQGTAMGESVVIHNKTRGYLKHA